MAPIPSFVKRLVLTAIAAAALSALVGTAARMTVWGEASAALHAQTPQPGPRRVISLVPATTEMMYLIGAGSRLAGVSNYDHFPPEVEKLPRVGGLLDPNVETLLSLKPDLVIVYDTQEELKQQLERARIPIFHYVHKGLPDITQTIRSLGERIGMKDAADAAATKIEQQLAAIGARVAGQPRPTTLLIFGREPGGLRQINASAGYGFPARCPGTGRRSGRAERLEAAVDHPQHGNDSDPRARGDHRGALRRPRCRRPIWSRSGGSGTRCTSWCRRSAATASIF